MNKGVTFQELIHPLTKAQFFSDIEGRGPYYFPGPSDRFEGLFSWRDVEQLLDMSSLWSDLSLKLVLDGAEVALEEYSVPGTTREGQGVMLPVASQLEAFLARGATVVLDRAENLTPNLAGLTRHLESVLGASLVCNVYCSWQAHQGFTSHNDTTDVYVLHIAGVKRWKIYTGRALNPSDHPGHNFSHFSPEHHARAKGQVLQELDLTPGDVLYLPRGQYHDALAGSDASLHLSFGINRALGTDFMHIIMESVADDPDFRQTLPHFDSPNALRSHLQVLAQRLHDQVADEALVAQVSDWQRQRVLRNTPVRIRLPEREARPWLRVRQSGLHLESDNGNTRLVDGEGRELELSAAEVTWVTWILNQELFAVEQFVTTFEEESGHAQKLLERLGQSGCLEPV
jgi:hypothetical protein